MRIDAADADDVERLADQWVALAAEQREHGTHLFPEENRSTVRETLLRQAITGEVLVARGSGAGRGAEVDDDGGTDGDREKGGADGDGGREGTDGDGGADGTDGDGGADGDPGEGDAPESVLGFVSFGHERTDYRGDADRGLVYNLYVVPERRGEGIGAALLRAAEERLAADGADVVALEAMADNEAARRFYRREGYRPHRVELEKPVGDRQADDRDDEGDRPGGSEGDRSEGTGGDQPRGSEGDRSGADDHGEE